MFNDRNHDNIKAMTAAIKELKADVVEFVNTRLQMLKSEISEKITAIKVALPMLVIALVFAVLALFVFTGALVYAISLGVGVGFALLIVGILYLLVAGGAVWMAMKEISAQSLAPKRTLKVLRQDQAWLQNEARSA